MKKKGFLVLVCILSLIPFNVKAIYYDDGKNIGKEIKEEEVRIMTDPDAPVTSSDGENQIDVIEPDKHDIPIGAEPAVDGITEDANDLKMKDDTNNNIVGELQDVTVAATLNKSKQNNNLLMPILISGGGCLILGITAYLLFIKRG